MDAVFAVVRKEYLKKWLTFFAEKDNIIPTMKAVSYTHLDVYKRQAPEKA